MRVAPSLDYAHRSRHERQVAQGAARRGDAALNAADHALRSNLAASVHHPPGRLQTGRPDRGLSALRSERRIPRRSLAAARRRRVRIYVPVIESRRHRAPALLPARRQDAARRVRHLDSARRRAPPRRGPALVRSDRRAAGRRRRRGPAPGNGRRLLRSGARLPASPPALLARPLPGRSRLRLSARRIGLSRSRTTCAWMRSRPNAAFGTSATFS